MPRIASGAALCVVVALVAIRRTRTALALGLVPTPA